jgi:hypothetical protein
MTNPHIREPERIRQDCARKVCGVQVSDHFRAILGFLLEDEWTTQRVLELNIDLGGSVVGRCEDQPHLMATRLVT